jgi:subtilisin family serine protease
MKLPSLVRLLGAAAQAALIALSPAAFAQPQGAAADHPFAQSHPVAGRYIVLFRDARPDNAAEAAAMVRAAGGQLHHSYANALHGFAASLPDAAIAALRRNPNVESIEQDQTVSLRQVSSPQNQATWGLDRIDQVDRPLDTQYQFTATGAGVAAFVIDTGIRADHTEFTGRLRPGYGVVADGNGTNDCNGHGTHVAGTVGGTTWGVAKGVTITPVRVLDCAGSGTWSDVIAGIDWVAASTQRPAVANMSLGGGASAALDAAVAGAVAKGVVMVVAAGNNSVDACTASPAREPSAITVGATTSSDLRAYYSNTGACVDLFAPGDNIRSAWNTSATAANTLSGTSMASPHVAGVAALMLQANPAATPAAIAAHLTSTATQNRLGSIGTGSPNLLLYSLGDGAPSQPATHTVAVQSMTGSSARTGGNWRASAVVTVRDVTYGTPMAGATVSAAFSPGGAASCVTGSTGTCTLGSGAIKINAAQSTTLTAGGITGAQLNYDATQNSVSQIVIGRP